MSSSSSQTSDFVEQQTNGKYEVTLGFGSESIDFEEVFAKIMEFADRADSLGKKVTLKLTME